MDEQELEHVRFCYADTVKRNALWLEVAACGWLAGVMDFPHAKTDDERGAVLMKDLEGILAEACCCRDNLPELSRRLGSIWTHAYLLSTGADEESSVTRTKLTVKDVGRDESLGLIRSFLSESAKGRRGFAQILRMAQVMA